MASRTFCLLKPDAIHRGLAGRILTMLEQSFVFVELRLVRPPRAQFEAHYAAHAGRDYFERAVDFMTSGPVIATVLERRAGGTTPAVEHLREWMGSYRDPAPGTIRQLFMPPGCPWHENLIHGSDSPEEAEREIALWFGEAARADPA